MRTARARIQRASGVVAVRVHGPSAWAGFTEEVQGESMGEYLEELGQCSLAICAQLGRLAMREPLAPESGQAAVGDLRRDGLQGPREDGHRPHAVAEPLDPADAADDRKDRLLEEQPTPVRSPGCDPRTDVDGAGSDAGCAPSDSEVGFAGRCARVCGAPRGPPVLAGALRRIRA